MTSRRFAVAGLLLATTTLLAACSTSPNDSSTTTASDGGSPAPTPLTVGLTYIPDIQFAPFYVAQSAGYYEAAGLEVELRHHGASESLFGAVEDGTEDLVVASGDEVLAQRAAGGTLTQVAEVFDDSAVALIVPKATGADSIADLAGATIGVPGEYGSTYLGLLMLLDEAGMTTSDVEVTSIGYTQTTALLTGQVDAVMGFVNGDAVRIDDGGMPVTTLRAEHLVGPGIATTDAMLAEEPEVIDAFVSATMEGVADLTADPEAAVEIAADYIPGMTEQAKTDALLVLEATIPLLSVTGENDPATWDAMGQAMLAAGMIDQIPSAGLVD